MDTYEKKYNESLERARKLSVDGYLDAIAVEEIFPELAESEDERIRRTLVEYFGPQVQLDFVRGVPIQKIRDWLEKQKEQSLRDFIDDFPYSDQKEQTPTEWSEEDEAAYNAFMCEVVNEKMNPTIDQIKWLRSICDRLKSLRPSWKPSEQEKGALRTAIHILIDERSFPKAAAQLQNILDAFEGKESRKDWKPSEEQIYSLGTVVKGYDECTVGSVGYNLKELYEQLKKLM